MNEKERKVNGKIVETYLKKFSEKKIHLQVWINIDWTKYILNEGKKGLYFYNFENKKLKSSKRLKTLKKVLAE